MILSFLPDSNNLFYLIAAVFFHFHYSFISDALQIIVLISQNEPMRDCFNKRIVLIVDI